MASFLKKRADYLHIYKSGRKSFHSSSIKVFVALNDLSTLRVGITVPATAGPAVVRNKIKRWIREHFRNTPSQLKGVDLNVVIIGKNKKAWQEMSFQKFSATLEQAVEITRKKITSKN